MATFNLNADIFDASTISFEHCGSSIQSDTPLAVLASSNASTAETTPIVWTAAERSAFMNRIKGINRENSSDSLRLERSSVNSRRGSKEVDKLVPCIDVETYSRMHG